MDRWENNIYGMVPKAEWLDVGFDVTRQNDPIDSLFDDKKTNNLFAEWDTIASEYQIPMMAEFHAFDTETKTTFRVPVDHKNIEKGLIKVKINQSERMRALLNSGVQDSRIKDYILRDGINLAEQVFTRSKVAKNEVMATGQMTIVENGLNLTIDYGVPAAQKAFSIDLVRTGDLTAQIQEIVDYATSKGITITGMMTSKKNITKMRNNAGLQKNINGNVGAGAIVRATDFNDFMSEEFGINQIITNDLSYGVSARIKSHSLQPIPAVSLVLDFGAILLRSILRSSAILAAVSRLFLLMFMFLSIRKTTPLLFGRRHQRFSCLLSIIRISSLSALLLIQAHDIQGN